VEMGIAISSHYLITPEYSIPQSSKLQMSSAAAGSTDFAMLGGLGACNWAAIRRKK